MVARVRLVRTAAALAVVAAVAGAGAVLLGVHAASGADEHASTRSRVQAGTDVCGTGWPAGGTTPHSGTQTYAIHNGSIAGVDVQLVQPRTGAVFLDAEGVGSGATVQYRVRIPRGDYQFRCLPADGDAVTGSVVHVTGSAHVSDATPGIVPVTQNDLVPAAKAYGDWIESRLPVLLRDVQTLDADVHAGDVPAARRDWTTAHTEYEQLGAAYGAFGDADTAIDGHPASGHTALDDPHLTGFHAIEARLWSGAPAADLASRSDALVAAVQHLQRDFPQSRVDPLDIGLRAHEILENALRLEMTGATDAGSHTSLATVDANISGTEHALAPIRGLLRTRYPGLPATDAALATARHDLEAARRPDGTWTPLAALDTATRERLDADLGDAVERLAPVAAICDPRRTS